MRKMMFVALFALGACPGGGAAEGEPCATADDCGEGLVCEATATTADAEATCVATETVTGDSGMEM